jgi:hypothetical protein
MDIQWVEELPSEGGPGRKGQGQTQRFVKELKNRPGEWALFRAMPKGRSWNAHVTYRADHPGTEWATRTVDGIAHVYARWVGKEK